MAEKLKEGDLFPVMSVETAAHGAMRLPADLGGDWAVVLFYRGWW